MKKFIVERKLPGAGNMTDEELQTISRTSVAVITILGKPYKWIESFVTEDKIYCIHEAEDEDAIRQHAKCGDFPVNKIEEIKTVINPTTAEKDN
jgi:Nickel responsive protein SCO4226-like